MKTVLLLVTALVFASAAKSETAAPPPAAAPAATAPASQAMVYELRELRPAGITQYSSAGDTFLRQYYEFKNDQGSHSIIYEEAASAPPLRNVISLREIATSWDSNCSIDIECSSRAFCTGECKHMYYEVANTPNDAQAPARNKCRIQYFSCQKNAVAPPPAAK